MKPEPEQDCMECLTDELKPENVAPVHDESRLFVDSQVGKGVYDGAKKTPGLWQNVPDISQIIVATRLSVSVWWDL